MSVFNYKGILLRKEENKVFYRYFPKYLETEDIFGEFKFDPNEWEPKITLETDSDIYIDERCVRALTHKIKKYLEEKGEMPEKVFWNA